MELLRQYARQTKVSMQCNVFMFQIMQHYRMWSNITQSRIMDQNMQCYNMGWGGGVNCTLQAQHGTAI